MTIGFVWPSVLEHMSTTLARTPVILDFHLTLIDTIKVQRKKREKQSFIIYL